MEKLGKVFGVLLVVISITACGFSPLYESGQGRRDLISTLASIHVEPMKGRLGQQMRNQLVTLLGDDQDGSMNLTVTLSQDREGFGIRPDAAATQEQLSLTATYRLTKSGADGDEILSGAIAGRVSYDLVLSDYATVTQREDSARRLALDLAERLHRRLALHFRGGS